jgi:hypothetical protein
MSEPKDKPATKPASPAGHVRHDKSGRAIWEWAIDTGRHALDSTSRLLKRLDMPGLALEDDSRKKAKPGTTEPEAPAAPQVPSFGGELEKDPLAGKRQGFNPYDSRSPPPRKTAPPSKPAANPASRPSSSRPAAPSAGKPGFLSKLFGGKR